MELLQHKKANANTDEALNIYKTSGAYASDCMTRNVMTAGGAAHTLMQF